MFEKVNHWIGTVECIDDPHRCGRIQVRVVGAFDVFSNRTTVTENKEKGIGLPTKDLPWAICSYPITFGGTLQSTLPAPGVQVGAWVHGISLDGDLYNELVVLGILPTFYNIDALSTNPKDSNFDMTNNDDALGDNEEKPESKGVGTLTFAQLLDGIHCAESNRGTNTSVQNDYLGDYKIHPTMAAKFIVSNAALKVENSGAMPFGTGDVYWPSKHRLITGKFGPRPSRGDYHGGIDIRAYQGDPIYAVADGTVKTSTSNYGIIDIEHTALGVCARYVHLSQRLVGSGSKVAAGQLIGYSGGVGKNGRTQYTPHLHFDVRKIGVPFGNSKVPGAFYNPEQWFAQYNLKAPTKGENPQSDEGVVMLRPDTGGSYTNTKDALKSAGIQVTDNFVAMVEELAKNNQYGSLNYEGQYQAEYKQLYEALSNNKPFNKLFGQLWLMDCLNLAGNDPLIAAFYYNQGQGTNGKNAVSSALGGNKLPNNMTYTDAAKKLSEQINSDFISYSNNVFRDHGGFENLEQGKDGQEKPLGRIIVRN